MDPKELRDEASRLRQEAEEIESSNPTAADYHRKRADWCEYLAREREEAEDRPS